MEIKEEKYRSEPKVNQPYDMVRVTLKMPLWKWRELKKKIEELNR